MRLRIVSTCVVLLSLCLVFPVTAQQETVSVPGSGVSFAPPKGFELSSEFAGLWDEATASSIVLSEMPAEAVPIMLERLSTVDGANAALASQNVTVDEVITIPASGGDITLLRGSQDVDQVTVDKWIALVPGDRLLLLTFNLSQQSTVEEDDVRQTLASLRLDEPATLEEKLAALPFVFQPCDAFPVVEVGAGLMVLMSENGTLGNGGRGMVLRFDGFESGIQSQRDLAVGFMAGEKLVSEGPASFGEGEGYRAETYDPAQGVYTIAFTFAHSRYSVAVTTIATTQQRADTQACLAAIAASFNARP